MDGQTWQRIARRCLPVAPVAALVVTQLADGTGWVRETHTWAGPVVSARGGIAAVLASAGLIQAVRGAWSHVRELRAIRAVESDPDALMWTDPMPERLDFLAPRVAARRSAQVTVSRVQAWLCAAALAWVFIGAFGVLTGTVIAAAAGCCAAFGSLVGLFHATFSPEERSRELRRAARRVPLAHVPAAAALNEHVGQVLLDRTGLTGAAVDVARRLAEQMPGGRLTEVADLAAGVAAPSVP